MDFNLIEFGSKLRSIRHKYKMTLEQVSESTGINSETIRRIESGQVIPKFETLELLSEVYKQDINSLFLTYRITNYVLYTSIINKLEDTIEHTDYEALQNDLDKLENIINDTSSSYLKNSTRQLYLLIKSVILQKVDRNYEAAYKCVIQGLKITTSDFCIKKYSSFAYSDLEIRLLMSLALIENKLGFKDLYIEILQHCLNICSPEIKLYPKLCYNLSCAYRRLKLYDKSMETAELGIQNCIKTHNSIYLPLMYYSKGLSLYFMENSEYVRYLRAAIVLCECYSNFSLCAIIAESYKKIVGGCIFEVIKINNNPI